ncbi:MAG: hypothetical protein RLZZ437_3085 [Pseudomonadota bacterium]|jgi:hypothetical protein
MTPDDLRAGVAAGIVTEAQAASLSALAHSRAGARENLAAGDEPFELFKGFNEIFIVVGLCILALGYAGVAGIFVALNFSDVSTRTFAAAVLGAGVLWLLAEYFVRRRRMIAPAIALSIMFAACAAAGLTAQFAEPFMVAQNEFSSLPLAIALTTLAIFLFWLRFKVPFAMAMIALGLFATALVLAAEQAGSPASFEDLFLLSAGGPFAWITLALGVAVFCVAMWFDMSDPHRVTRRSANGFWLHVVAAPALVNTVALSLLAEGQSGLLLAFLALIAVVAVVIDRRSFLIAGVGYSVTLSATVFDAEGSVYTVLLLGVLLVLMGAFWERIRAVLLRMMPFLPLKRLPPSTVGPIGGM